MRLGQAAYTTWLAVHRWQLRHPRLFQYLVFGFILLVASYGFYRRFPDNWLYPNFFAEDGQIFTHSLLSKGFFSAMFTTFNGYFVVGIYLLTGLGFLINMVFLGGQFVNLPAALAVASYLFYGFCAAVPWIMLRPYLRWPYRLVLAATILCLPMPEFDYGTLGTVGNVKFAFLYFAVLLMLYRIKLPRTSRLIWLVDVGLLVCAFTTVSVYLVLPFALAGDGLSLKQLWQAPRRMLKRTNVALWSLLILGVLVCLQLIIIAIHGIPKFPGYLDQPYQWSKTIEVFAARPYLYPFVSFAYRHLQDWLVVALMAAWLALIWRYGRRSWRWVYGLGLFAVLATTVVFVSNRTGVSVYYNHYHGSGFDNFFYTQNFLALMVGVFLLADLNQRLGWFRHYRIGFVATGLVLAGELYANSAYATNDFMQYHVGTLKSQAAEACRQSHGSHITFMVYPFTFLTMTEPRDRVCTSALAQQNWIDNFHLQPAQGQIINLAGNPRPGFTQTFVARHPSLNGLALYLGTYYQKRLQGYQLRLLTADCKTPVRTVSLPYKINDNTYSTIMFAPVPHSQGQTYCFTVVPDRPSVQALAISESAERVYGEGQLTVAGQPSDRDAVFAALYLGH